ncbi:hypothetical protein [Xanthomonas arboricola]|uniref:hypothetical protein n=1 Tax=Xanthomonas arboricola TaxID=56448 RepID=UPI000584559E|nr:hypothetical protein [Xanthomonas arboricola]MDN0209078.1 hypothetical protein [Xanthomonas arboricola pv. corylina]MDN0213472.1 hypothetical protein [Xanthomonas arboricola pv. corylina]QUI80730.1 hypothetical protein ICA18_21815 [Xanthomonas arboricola pv. corylina]UQQ10655.1 hypothetical protein KP021_21805 [Xanthomonas arboricola pv. corylina]UQQ15792.1 hypothetical protein KPG65_04885 [Xanthomonas arboricola pv. corylina]
MHPFTELATRCVVLTSGLLDETRTHVLAELQESGATSLVKALQALELQGAIVAVGMVAMFEAALQEALGSENGFRETERLIESAGQPELRARFTDVQLAVNVLKHGRGRSHNDLLARRDALPFRVRAEDEFFEEGNLSEIATLVQADDAFLHHCSETIDLVAAVVREARPDAWL